MMFNKFLTQITRPNYSQGKTKKSQSKIKSYSPNFEPLLCASLFTASVGNGFFHRQQGYHITIHQAFCSSFLVTNQKTDNDNSIDTDDPDGRASTFSRAVNRQSNKSSSYIRLVFQTLCKKTNWLVLLKEESRKEPKRSEWQSLPFPDRFAPMMYISTRRIFKWYVYLGWHGFQGSVHRRYVFLHVQLGSGEEKQRRPQKRNSGTNSIMSVTGH